MSVRPEIRSRWLIEATYRTDHGPVDVHHEVEELEALHDLIEAGPDWNTLIDIRITLNPARITSLGLTVERAKNT